MAYMDSTGILIHATDDKGKITLCETDGALPTDANKFAKGCDLLWTDGQHYFNTAETEAAASFEIPTPAGGDATSINGFDVDTEGVKNSAETFFATFIPLGAPQALTGAGAIDPSSYQTKWTSSGTGQALTLADGTIGGQLKKVIYVAEGGGADTGVITASTGLFTSVTLNAVNDYVTFQWVFGIGWNVVETLGVTVA